MCENQNKDRQRLSLDMNHISNTKKTIKGLSTQTIVTICMGLGEIIPFSILSRLLSKEDFGYFAAIMAITNILMIFSEAGIGAALVQRKELTKRYIDTAFTLGLLLGMVISILLFIFSKEFAETFIDSKMVTPLKLISITILFHSLSSINISLMQRRLEFLKVGLIRLFSLLITNIIAIILAIYHFGYYAIIVKAVLDAILTYLVSLTYTGVNFRLCLDKQMCSDIFKFSGWLTLSSLFRNISRQIDKLVMPKVLSVSVLGAYNRPKEFITLISNKINGIFDVVMFPILSGIKDNISSLCSAFKKSIYFVNLLSALLFLLFFINSDLIVCVFFGEEWIELSGLFKLLSVAVLFNINGRLADCFLRSMGLTKEQFYFRVSEMVVNLIGVLVGCRWGMIGVAAAVVICDASMKLIKIYYVAHLLNISVLFLFTSLFKSWKFFIIQIPFLYAIYLLTPSNIFGYIFVCLVFLIINIILFCFFPAVIGNSYYNVAYPHVKKILSSILKQFT